MTPEKVLVDTSGWICFFARKGFPQIKQALVRLLDANRVAVTGPIFLELIQGCRNEKEKREMERCLQGLHWLAVEDRHWHQAADLAFSLRRKGVTVSAMDALIATIAVTYNCAVLHKDRDYDLITRSGELLKLYTLSHP